MKKQLKAAGNGWELYFSKPLLQLLGYNPELVTLLITSYNKTIYVYPVDDIKKYKSNLLKKLYKRGLAGYALYMSLTILEILEINPEVDLLDIEVAGNKLIIKKAEK